MTPELNNLKAAQHEFWRMNAAVAVSWFENLQDDSVDLGFFSEEKSNGKTKKPSIKHTCGSVACIGGWIAVLPYFKNLGIGRNLDGSPEFQMLGIQPSAAASYYLFGDSLFASRSDKECTKPKLESKSDREIAIHRLKKRIKAITKLEDARMDADACE